MRFGVKAVGAIVVLVSLFLAWFSFVGSGISLYQLAQLVFDPLFAPSVGMFGAAIILGTLVLVVIGGFVSFVYRGGAVVTLAGVGWFMYGMSSLVPGGLRFLGIGIFVAIAGAIVVLTSATIARRIGMLA